MRTNFDLSAIPPGILIGLGVVLLLQISLDVVALVDLYRRPVSTVTLGNKWAWVAIIVLVNLVGAILYFAIGRKRTEAVDAPVAPPKRSSADIADALYGDPDQPKSQ